MLDATKEKTQVVAEEMARLPAIVYDFYRPRPESAKPGESGADGAGEKPRQKTPLLQKKAVQKAKWFIGVVFRKLQEIYCHNICTYSNMVLIGAVFLLCISGAFSQAAFGILVFLNLVISIFSDRKERKRLEKVLWKEGGEGELDEVVVRRRKSKLEKSLDAYGRRMGAVAGVFGLVLFVQAFMFRYESFRGSVVSMCSAFVAAMPIGMYVLNHFANFVGAARLSKKGLKVQDKRAVMRLAGTDVLCVGDSSLFGEFDSPVMEALRAFQDDGVRVILISGEEPEALLEKAKKAGIVEDGRCVDAATLNDMDAMRKAVLRSTVIGNATSLQKSIFVNILRESGNMVTMVAKGEDDCAAVQNADVSVGFAPREGDTAGLSDMYAKSGGFDLLATAYEESGALNQNLRNLSSLFFMKNVTALLLALYAVVCSIPYPVTLSMWTLLGIFTIGIPSLPLFLYTLSDAKRPLARSASNTGCPDGYTLSDAKRPLARSASNTGCPDGYTLSDAKRPPARSTSDVGCPDGNGDKKHEERFLLKSIKNGLPAALAGTVAVIVLLRYGIMFDLDTDGTVTAAVLLLAFAGFLMLGKLCLPISSFDVMLLAICVAGFLCCFLFFGPLFGMAVMNMRIAMLLVLFLIAEESLYRLLCFLVQKAWNGNSA